MSKTVKTGLLVAVLLAVAIMVYINLMQQNNKVSLNDPGDADNLSVSSVQIEPESYQPKKVVSIPKPLTVATNKDLTPKAKLIQPDASNQAEFMQNQLGQSNNSDQADFQVPQDVVDKLTEQTGISQQDMQRAMTEQSN